MILKRANVEVIEDNAEKIMELKAAGFVPIDGEPAAAPAEKALGDMTVKELRAAAKAKGIELSSTLRKQDLIEILEAEDDRDSEGETDKEAESTD